MIALVSLLVASVAKGSDLRWAPKPADRARVLADGLVASRDALANSLIVAYQPGGPLRPGSTGVTAFRSWMFLWKWCDLLSRTEKSEAARHLAAHLRLSAEGKLAFFGPGYVPSPELKLLEVEELNRMPSEFAEQGFGEVLPADLASPTDQSIFEKLDPAIVAEWINDQDLSRLLFENLTDKDYVPGALLRLQEIHQVNAQKFREYRSLAVALALVYDQKFPRFWPHRQVDQKDVPMTNSSVGEQFTFWVQSNESRALFYDLRMLSPAQIKYIVDAPVAPSELEWARKFVRYQRSEFSKAFDAVSYSMDRVTSRRFRWTSGDYTLQNIRQHDGICVDQAYYAMVAGKARGLPTLFFTGQGAQGGHAWFGYMKSENRWELDCGRYKNQNYAVGEALDPQTWSPISDHKLEFQARGLREGLEYFSSQDDILIGRMMEDRGDKAKALKAYESAIQVCPRNEAGWAAKADYLLRTGAPLNTLKAHHEAALRQFLTDRDIRVGQQVALAGIARKEGALAEAEALERQVIAQNKRRRSDLSVSVAAQKITSLIAGKQFDQAFTEYRRQLSNLGKTGGGNFFYDIVQPFAEALVAAGNQRQAKEVISLARQALKPANGSLIDHDLRELETSLADSSSG